MANAPDVVYENKKIRMVGGFEGDSLIYLAMDLEITESGFDAPVVIMGQAGIELSSRYGGGYFHCYQGQGFSFWNNCYRFSSDTTLHARANMPVLELHITRTGVWSGNWDGIDELDLHPGHFNLTYTPHVMTTAFFRKKAVYRSCDIHFEAAYLQSLAVDFPALDAFLLSVARGDPGSLTPRNHYCTREMIAATEAILDNPFGPKVQPYILKMKVREILISALEKVAEDLAKPMPVIRGSQREALFHVKSTIELAGDMPLSLAELSKLAGLNECTLKRGFRLLFGVSPYQYYVELKMKKAKDLLLATNEPVAAIAYELGYAQPSSFGHEFRKATGVSPMVYRRMGGIM